MYAVIESGGKQYRVAPGGTIAVEKLPGAVGAEVEFTKVLAVGKGAGELLAGAAALDGAKVKGAITAHGRGDKVIVFKFKRKKQYKRTQGHRQHFTEVRVRDIVV
jgi:large subunit ribosomal protein L21